MTSAYAFAILKPDGTYSIRIYGERHPTTALRPPHFFIMEMTGENYGRAEARLMDWFFEWHPELSLRIE